MKIETFIFVHDQQIILDFKENNKFKEVENLKYVFVSNNPCDKIENMEDVIIAKKYDDNIEKYNRTLLAYTGWYLLWKNKLYNADYINLFEYDIILDPSFTSKLNEKLKSNPDVVGYMPLPTNHPLFLKVENNAGPLVRSITKNYFINPIEEIEKFPVKNVSLTFNQTLKVSLFEEFMEWMAPIIEDVKEERMAGHFPERALPFYYTIKNYKLEMLDVLQHFQMDTHDTQGKTKAFFETHYKSLLNGK